MFLSLVAPFWRRAWRSLGKAIQKIVPHPRAGLGKIRDSSDFAAIVQKILPDKTCNSLIKISFFYEKNVGLIAIKFISRYHRKSFIAGKRLKLTKNAFDTFPSGVVFFRFLARLFAEAQLLTLEKVTRA